MECEKQVLDFLIGASTGYEPNEECSTEDSSIGAACHHDCYDHFGGEYI